MKNLLLLLITCCILTISVFSQNLMTRNGHIRFFSDAPLEDIEANNYQVTSIVNLDNNELVFSLLMKGFEFEKALMQEHFNEKYVESDLFPKATFNGKFISSEEIDLQEEGTYEVDVTGDLTIHGVTKKIETTGIFTVKNGELSGKTKFIVTVADYNIKIPSVVRDNIAEEVEVTVNVVYNPMK